MTDQQGSGDLRQLARDMIEELRASGAVPGLEVGESAPHFRLANAVGREVSLADLLAEGPTVVVFYRGAWCPICNTHLRALRDGLDEIGQRGASLVAISPQSPDDSLAFAERLDLGFEVLSDVDQAVTRQWRLHYELPEALRDVYRAMQMDLEIHNADGSWNLPVPATFVLDRDGVVQARHVDPNYRERMGLDDLLAALDAISPHAN